MRITVDLHEDTLARLHAEATRRDVSIDLVIAELSMTLPTDQVPARKTLSLIGLGSSSSGRSARDADELLADGFGRK